MRTMDASAIIGRAKQLQGFEQDQGLAEWLDVSRTTLASWKRRDSIPAKYLFRMIEGTEASIDWLVEGKDREILDEYEYFKGKQLIDPDVLWIALLLYQMKMSDGSASEKKIAEALDGDNLVFCHTFLGNFITLANDAKQKWLKSGIVKGDDVYKAIATELGVSLFFDYPPHPWWK